MGEVSMRQYAAHRRARGLPGGTHESVRRAVRDGRISLDDDGLIDPEVADADWAANTRFRIDHAPNVDSGSAYPRELAAMVVAACQRLVATTDSRAVFEIATGLARDAYDAGFRQWALPELPEIDWAAIDAMNAELDEMLAAHYAEAVARRKREKRELGSDRD